MESSLAGIVNVWLCLAIVLGLFVYRRHGAAHKPMITWLAYWLMLGYIIIPFRWLSGTYTHSSWLVVALNLVFCALIVWAHGNLSKILSLLRHPHEIKAVTSITRMIRVVRPNGALRKKLPAPTDTVVICAI